jgi:Flp pilus assembly pilin Flp
MTTVLKSFWQNDSGATSVEYALIAIVVGVGIIGSMQEVTTSVLSLFGQVEEGFDR